MGNLKSELIGLKPIRNWRKKMNNNIFDKDDREVAKVIWSGICHS